MPTLDQPPHNTTGTLRVQSLWTRSGIHRFLSRPGAPAEKTDSGRVPSNDSETAATILTTAAAIERHGISRVRSAVHSRRWQQPYRGVVVTHSGPLSPEHRRVAILVAAPPGSALGGLTAAALDGLRGFETDVIDLLIPHRARRPNLPGVRIHRSMLLGDDSVHPKAWPTRTTIERSIIDAAAWATSDNRARALLASAVQQRLTTPDLLRLASAARGPFRRQRLLLVTLDDVEGGAESLPELEFTALLRRARLPEPQRQCVVARASGKYYLDAEWEEWSVTAEIDGSHHLGVNQWIRDLERQNEITASGRRVLRFASFQIRNEPVQVARTIARALQQAGWTGTARV